MVLFECLEVQLKYNPASGYPLIELLIQSYYNIVKRTMIDMVPKAIMLNLVDRAKKELQRELLTELYKADVLDDLLHESEFTQQRRKECKKMIEVRPCRTSWDFYSN